MKPSLGLNPKPQTPKPLIQNHETLLGPGREEQLFDIKLLAASLGAFVAIREEGPFCIRGP